MANSRTGKVVDFAKVKSTYANGEVNEGGDIILGTNKAFDFVIGPDSLFSISCWDDYASTIGANVVYEIRSKANLTQRELALKVGLSQQKISLLEGGRIKKGISLGALFAIAHACGVTLSIKATGNKTGGINVFDATKSGKGSGKSKRVG